MQNDITLSLHEAHLLAMKVLRQAGFSEQTSSSVAEAVVAGERDGCKSHGLYRLLVCVHSLNVGKVNPVAEPILREGSPSLMRIDAGQGYSLTALAKYKDDFCNRVKQQGVAAMVINRCVHFSALWYDIEQLTEKGIAALAMTPSHAWVAPAGGSRPLFGTNPIAFGWPREGGNPYVFDFATSAIARGDIELHRREGKPLEPGWGIDKNGKPSISPESVLEGAMLTFGGHKGSALSTMVELMAGALINDLTSKESMALDGGSGASPLGGELIVGFDCAKMSGGNASSAQRKAEDLFNSIIDQGARLPSQRRFENRLRALREGVTITGKLYADIQSLMVTG